MDWIKVEDRLPEDHQMVLVWAPDSGCSLCYYKCKDIGKHWPHVGFYWYDEMQEYTYTHFWDGVTHWAVPTKPEE